MITPNYTIFKYDSETGDADFWTRSQSLGHASNLCSLVCPSPHQTA